MLPCQASAAGRFCGRRRCPMARWLRKQSVHDRGWAGRRSTARGSCLTIPGQARSSVSSAVLRLRRHRQSGPAQVDGRSEGGQPHPHVHLGTTRGRSGSPRSASRDPPQQSRGAPPRTPLPDCVPACNQGEQSTPANRCCARSRSGRSRNRDTYEPGPVPSARAVAANQAIPRFLPRSRAHSSQTSTSTRSFFATPTVSP